jgi:hypothetical protein
MFCSRLFQTEESHAHGRVSLILISLGAMRLSLEGIMERSVSNAAKRYSLIVLVSVVAATVVFPYPLHAQEAEANPPSLDLIL